MSNLTFGLTLMVFGMGGTVLALALFSMLMTVLKKLFPFEKEDTKKGNT